MSKSDHILHLGAGCFWSSEKTFLQKKGVTETEVGWSTYHPEGREQPSKVEVVRVEYNPKKTSLKNLIETFWTTHDPASSRNKDPYFVERSMLFAINQDQLKKFQLLLTEKKQKNPSILTEVALMDDYIRAPEKDQQYYLKNS